MISPAAIYGSSARFERGDRRDTIEKVRIARFSCTLPAFESALEKIEARVPEEGRVLV